MQVMSFNEFKNLISKLEERGKTKTSDFLMYLVLPFLKSLGYNVYELDEVDMDMEKEVVTVKTKEDLKILVSINQNLIEYMGIGSLEDNDIKIYINIGLDEKEIKLYYNVLEKWEEIVVVDLEEDNADVYAKDFTKRIAKEVLNREIENNGKKFLTEKVLDARLEEGDWGNDFTMYGLLEELTNPTDEFINLMAGRLSQDYTTKDVDWIKERLEKAKEEGFLSVISRLRDKGYLDIENGEQEINEPEEEKEQEVNDDVEETEENFVDNITDVEEKNVDDAEEQITDVNEDVVEEEQEREEGFTNIDNYIQNVKESKGFNEKEDNEDVRDEEENDDNFPSIDGLIGSDDKEDIDTEEKDDNDGEDFQDLLDRT